MALDTLYLVSSLIHIILIILYLWSWFIIVTGLNWFYMILVSRDPRTRGSGPEPVGPRTAPRRTRKNMKSKDHFAPGPKKWNYRTAPSRNRNKYSWESKDSYDGQMVIIDVILVSVILVVSVNLVMKRSFWSWTDGHIGKNTVISGYRIFSKIHDSLSSIGILDRVSAKRKLRF